MHIRSMRKREREKMRRRSNNLRANYCSKCGTRLKANDSDDLRELFIRAQNHCIYDEDILKFADGCAKLGYKKLAAQIKKSYNDISKIKSELRKVKVLHKYHYSAKEDIPTDIKGRITYIEDDDEWLVECIKPMYLEFKPWNEDEEYISFDGSRISTYTEISLVSDDGNATAEESAEEEWTEKCEKILNKYGFKFSDLGISRSIYIPDKLYFKLKFNRD